MGPSLFTMALHPILVEANSYSDNGCALTLCYLDVTVIGLQKEVVAIYDGFKILGTPVGHDEFVENACLQQTEREVYCLIFHSYRMFSCQHYL